MNKKRNMKGYFDDVQPTIDEKEFPRNTPDSHNINNNEDSDEKVAVSKQKSKKKNVVPQAYSPSEYKEIQQASEDNEEEHKEQQNDTIDDYSVYSPQRQYEASSVADSEDNYDIDDTEDVEYEEVEALSFVQKTLLIVTYGLILSLACIGAFNVVSSITSSILN